MATPRQSPDLSQPQDPYSGTTSRETSRDLIHSRANQPSTRLRLRLTGLPPQTSTLDIYENLHRYGSIVRINLFETREGLKSTRAEVDFQPAPSNVFWRRPILFETRSHQSAEVHFQTVNNLPQVFTKESPLRKGVKYNDRTELSGKALDFGVLVEPTTMMVMGRSGSMQQKPKLVLNLNRKEIEVHFPWQQISSNRSAVRTFRFNIALDAEVRIWELWDHSFVLHLAKPPWYSKQLAEAIANTHSPDARLWTIEDTWARQTDLWTHKQSIPEINSSPITLAKYHNDVNIFRWTTFRFDPVNENANMCAVRTFVEALRDWNVKVQPGEEFKTFTAEPGLDKKVWKLINGTSSDEGSLSRDNPSCVHLPFAVRYQLEVCLSHGWLIEYSMTPSFLRQLSQLPETKAKQALLYVAIDQKKLFDPTVIFRDIHYSRPVRAKRLPDNCIEICSATVTTTGILFNTPAVEITNRIIRNHKAHAHRFLRVRFEDDEYRGQTRLYPSTNNKMVMIFTRVKRALTYGIRLGNVLYEFLAWGNSQLREHGAYFFASVDGLTADSIRAEMGHFKETVVAKKAARMGQCFSTTRPVRLQLRMVHEPDTIPDIIRNGYTFTDGVGKISPAAAELVATQLQIKGPVPCLFQFRLGGCKGVLAVSQDVPDVDVRIRKSQLKFKALANELEINRYARFWQASLNRQIILCLSSLGVPTEVFIRRQSETIAVLNKAMHDDGAAINALRSNIDPNMMTLELAHMVEAGFRESQDPFVVSLLELWRAWSLKYLKEKAKIPIEEGAFVLGTVDETASLKGHTNACPSGEVDVIMADPAALEKLPEIFLQITDHKTGGRRVIEGLCILARNPSLHRGDIRVVQARNVPALHHMCDVVVMPQLGDRDLPSMCSGGDLDGDDYIVIWAKDLLPRFWNAEPFHYEPPVPKTAAGEIKTSDLIDFFHDYMQNDTLGKIATAHMAAADYFDDGLENRICLDLAQLHSMAVDYPKTGVPAKMERRLERPEKPHFMEPYGKPYYSRKVLGRLYDEINKFHKGLQKSTFVKHDLDFDERILSSHEPDTDLFDKVENVKRAYDISLQRILTQHSIQTEFELWSTFVLEHSKKSRDYKFHEEVGDLSRVLKEEFYEELCDLAGGRDFDHLAPVAVAAYRLTQKQFQAAKLQAQPSSESEDEAAKPTTFISFPWILQDTLMKIASQIDNRNTQSSTNEETIAKYSIDSVETPAADELYDVANFHLKRDKLSPYLPDPMTTNIVASTCSTAEGLDRQTPDQAAARQHADILDHRSSRDAGTALHTDHKIILPVEEIPSSLPGSRHEPTADKALWNAANCLREDGSHFISIGDQSRPRSSDSEDAQPEKLAPQDSPSVETSDRSQTRPVKIPSSPRAQQTNYVNSRSRRQATCFYWKMGQSCRYSEQECKYAHHDTGIDMPEKQQITCYYWFNGKRCNLDDVSCKFAHHDTGYYASKPLRGASSKGRHDSMVRVVVESSESDNEDEDLVPVHDAPQTPLTAKTHPLRKESDERHEQIDGYIGQLPSVHGDYNAASNFAQQKAIRRSPVTQKALPMVPTEESPAAYINDALVVRGVTREPAVSSRSPKMSSGLKSFVPVPSVRSATYTAQTLPRSNPPPQLINVAHGQSFGENSSCNSRYSKSQSHGGFNKNRSSWADLEGLVFNDSLAAAALESVTSKKTDLWVTAGLGLDNNPSSLHSDLIDMSRERSQQLLAPTNEVIPKEDPVLAKNTEREAESALLIDLLDDTKPNISRGSSSPDLLPPRPNGRSPSKNLSAVNDRLALETSTKKESAHIFGDPLASHDVDDEPEIEELFD